MKQKRFHVLLIVVGLLMVFLAVGIVEAATPYDLADINGPNLHTINGAIFERFLPGNSAGTGTFDTFLKLGGKDVIKGYNTDFGQQFDEDNAWTKAILLSVVPQFNVNGIIYREFQLDINQNNTTYSRYESLDEVEVYESPYANLCGYPFNGSGGGQTGCTTDNTATLVYDMDGLDDSFVVLNFDLNDGSGKRDMRVMVPSSLFNQDPNCQYGGTGCLTYVTLYSQFGGDATCPAPYAAPAATTCPNNDGFEEWGVRVGLPTAITLQNISASNGATGAGFVIAAVGLLAIGTGLVLILRKRQPVEV
jgi:hypothetical protein